MWWGQHEPIKTINKLFSYYYYYSYSYSSIKIFPATSHSSSSQTTEPIVKCHTILEMGSHDLSPHAFRSGPPFCKGAQKGVLRKLVLNLFSAKGGSNQMN